MNKQESTLQRLWRLQNETPDETRIRLEFEKRQREIMDAFKPRRMDINSHHDRATTHTEDT